MSAARIRFRVDRDAPLVLDVRFGHVGAVNLGLEHGARHDGGSSALRLRVQHAVVDQSDFGCLVRRDRRVRRTRPAPASVGPSRRAAAGFERVNPDRAARRSRRGPAAPCSISVAHELRAAASRSALTPRATANSPRRRARAPAPTACRRASGRGSALRLDIARPSGSRTVGAPTISTSKQRSAPCGGSPRAAGSPSRRRRRRGAWPPIQELRDDGGDAAEVPWPRGAAQRLAELRIDLDPGLRRPSGIQLAGVGPEDERRRRRLARQSLEVGFESAGIVVEGRPGR